MIDSLGSLGFSFFKEYITARSLSSQAFEWSHAVGVTLKRITALLSESRMRTRKSFTTWVNKRHRIELCSSLGIFLIPPCKELYPISSQSKCFWFFGRQGDGLGWGGISVWLGGSVLYWNKPWSWRTRFSALSPPCLAA